MNIYLLSRVRLGTPLKYVKGLAFADTLTKKDAEPAGERPFCVMCQQKARPFTDLRGVPSRTLLKGAICIEVTPRGDTLSLNLDLKSARISRARQMSSIVSLEVPFVSFFLN